MKKVFVFTVLTIGMAGISAFCANPETREVANENTEARARLAQEAAAACIKEQAFIEFDQIQKSVSASGKTLEPSFTHQEIILSLARRIYQGPLTAFFEKLPFEKLSAYHLLITHPGVQACERDIWKTLTDGTIGFRYDLAYGGTGLKPDLPNTRLGERFKKCVSAIEWGRNPKHNMFYDLYNKLQETHPEAVALINNADVSLEDLNAERVAALGHVKNQYVEEIVELMKANKLIQ